MGTGYGAESEDEHRQNRAGRKGVAKKRKCAITPGEPCGHDARTNDAREQEGRSQTLGNTALCQRWH